MTEQQDAVKKVLAEQQEATKKSREEAFDKMNKCKPTPTQEENDRTALGEHIMEHEDDGSEPELHTRQVEAKRPSGGGYATRSSSPSRSSPPRSE